MAVGANVNVAARSRSGAPLTSKLTVVVELLLRLRRSTRELEGEGRYFIKVISASSGSGELSHPNHSISIHVEVRESTKSSANRKRLIGDYFLKVGESLL